MSSERIINLLWQISWQTALLAAVVGVIARAFRRAPSAWKHGLWLVVLLKFLVPPLIPWPASLEPGQGVRHGAPVTEGVLSPVLPTEAKEHSASAHVPRETKGTPVTAVPFFVIGDLLRPSLLLGAWLVGVSLTVGLLVVRCVRQGGIIRRSVAAGEELLGILAECTERLGMRRAPGLRLSPEVPTPMLLGLWRPVILLPAGITESCSPHDLRAMLLHELAHACRRDLLVVWLYQLEKVLFFFHPGLWLAGRGIRKERESACDELVLSRSAIARTDYAAGYISALRLANGLAAVPAAVAMAEPFEVEKRRLAMILRETSPRLSAGWVAGLLVVIAAGLPTFGACAASQRPTVEMVSSALRKQVKACGDSLQLRYSVSGHPAEPASVVPIFETRYVRTPQAIFMEVISYTAQHDQKEDRVQKYLLDRVTKEEKNMTVRVSDGSVLNGSIGRGAAQSTITSLTTMETAMLCLLSPDALLYECIRYGTISEEPEVVDGHRCWRIDIPAEKFLGEGFHDWTFTAWVDPDIGFCPRRLDRRAVRTANDHDVTSIRLRGYHEAATGVWFPTEQVVESSRIQGTVVSTLRDIQVGEPVSPKDIAIEFPPGLRIQTMGRTSASAASSKRPNRTLDRPSIQQVR